MQAKRVVIGIASHIGHSNRNIAPYLALRSMKECQDGLEFREHLEGHFEKPERGIEIGTSNLGMGLWEQLRKKAVEEYQAEKAWKDTMMEDLRRSPITDQDGPNRSTNRALWRKSKGKRKYGY